MATLAKMVRSMARNHHHHHHHHHQQQQMQQQKRFLQRLFGSTPESAMPMKAGTALKNLAIFMGQDVPVTLERSEYPEWVSDLAKPQPSLAALRKIPNEQADLDRIKRYLKLTRRQAVRQRNEESSS